MYKSPIAHFANEIAKKSTRAMKSNEEASLWLAITGSLILAPAGVTLYYLQSPDLAVFLVNLAAIIPTATVYRRSLRDLVWWFQLSSMQHGKTLGGLLDTLLGYTHSQGSLRMLADCDPGVDRS